MINKISTASLNGDISPENVIKRDVCIIGGGASGAYTALRLQDHHKSVIVIDRNERLGGHAESYHDPHTGKSLDLGVIVFGHLDEVKNLFSRFNIALKKAPTSLGVPNYVDMSTGRTHNIAGPNESSVVEAFQKYEAQLSKYPGLQTGFHLTYPVSEDLLLLFGEFVQKYSLEAMVPTVFAICQGYIPLLAISMMYLFKYLNADLLNTLREGFLMTEHNNIGLLYDRIAAELGSNSLLRTTIVAMDRSCKPTRVLVQTPSGRKLILAKKIVSTIPHNLSNLREFDLSECERELFGQFQYTAYYASIIRHVELPFDAPIHTYAPDTAHNLPSLPGIYAFNAHPATGLFQAYYACPKPLPEQEIKADIVRTIRRIQKDRGICPSKTPEFAAFANHTPFNMTVSNDAIQNRFYEKLYALQGERNTFFNGASFHTQDSSVLWRFTEALIPRILESL